MFSNTVAELYENISQKSRKGIQSINCLSEVIELSDGSCWLQVLHHNNRGNTNKFSSGDAFATTFVYHNDECWSAFPLITQYGLYNSQYEFLALDERNDRTWKLQRWGQNTNPVISTATPTITSGSCTFGGLRKNGSNTFMSRPSNWWAACGAWNGGTWGGVTGVPGFWNQSEACPGVMDLFIRVSPENAKKYREFNKGVVMSTVFNEI